VVLMAALAWACSGTPVQLPTFDRAEVAARGREDYLRSCAPCHGADGRGGARGPDLTHLSATMGSRFSHQYVVDVITGARDVAAHGPREMPVWDDRFGSVDSGAEAAASLWMQRRLDALATQVEALQVGVAPSDQR
jgi:mono/diheme cytochrome c family protein